MLSNEFEDEYDESASLAKKYESAREKGEVVFFTEQEYEEIIDYYAFKKEYEAALSVANECIKGFKYTDTFHVKKAEIYLDLNQAENALESIETALVFSPNEISIILLKADALLQLSKFKEAINLVENAMHNADKEEKIDLYLELADIYEEWDKNYEVIDCLEECLKLNPENEEALNRMWFSVELTKSYERSVLIHAQLIEHHPYNLLAWYNIAHAYQALNNYDKAIEAFEFAMVIDEDYIPAFVDAASLYCETKKYDKGIAIYEDLLELGEESKDIYYQLAKAYQSTNKYIKARENFKRAINLDPYFAKAFHSLGLNYLESKLPKNALSPLEKAVKLEPKNYEFLNSMAAAYFLNEAKDKAVEIYYKMLEINNLDKRIYLNIISIMYENGSVQDAVELIDLAITLFDDNKSDLLYIKTAFLYDLGKKNQMYEALLKALENNPEDYSQLFELIPEMENDNAVMSIIESYQKEN
ncbi:MAG: tetratricopeptide repeat protein [Chitinophagales bacterium]|nr:tetratricopeptide repeat protein [Chitinophagales bacterium]